MKKHKYTNRCNTTAALSGLFLLATLLMATAQSHSAAAGLFDDTTVTVGGFIKIDAALGKDTSGPLNYYGRRHHQSVKPEESRTTAFSANGSRIYFGTESEQEDHKITTYLELDFYGKVDIEEKTENAFVPRLRHAYIGYDNWLIGQTWTTFRNKEAIPESADIIGNPVSGIYVRQPQIRYTSGSWQLAVEDPETTISNPMSDRIVVNEMPDIIGRFNFSEGDLQVSAAVMIRKLSYSESGYSTDRYLRHKAGAPGIRGRGFFPEEKWPPLVRNDSVPENDSGIHKPAAEKEVFAERVKGSSEAIAVGFSITGKYTFGSDDIRFGVSSGTGLGRYIGLNAVSDAAVKFQLRGNKSVQNLKAIGTTSYYVSLRHFWDEQWRSNFTYSGMSVDTVPTPKFDNDPLESVDSYRVNIIYSPVKRMNLGLEISVADRELMSGADSRTSKLQFTAQMSF